ncbi:MAG: hypothetical protein ABI823_07270 [Bryobacteraceae bacterium]
MTGIVASEDSFYMRGSLYPAKPAVLLDLFETPSRWLGKGWLDAQHVVEYGASGQQLRCVWEDGVSVVTFDLHRLPSGGFHLSASLDSQPGGAHAEIVSRETAMAQQRLAAAIDGEQL